MFASFKFVLTSITIVFELILFHHSTCHTILSSINHRFSLNFFIWAYECPGSFLVCCRWLLECPGEQIENIRTLQTQVLDTCRESVSARQVSDTGRWPSARCLCFISKKSKTLLNYSFKCSCYGCTFCCWLVITSVLQHLITLKTGSGS